MTEIRRKAWLAFALCLLLATAATAQQTTGTINGRVADESGALIPGVQVTLTSPAIQGERTTITDEAGNYRFLLMPPGVYTVAYELSGFQKLIREGIIVQVERTTTLNVALGVAARAETLTVTGESPVVDVQNVNVSSSFNQDLLESLPTARDLWAVLRQTPGLQMTGFDVGGSTMGTQTGYRSYGRSGQNWTTLDGVATTEGTGTTGVYYDYGSFSEISISSAGNSAEVAVPGSSINTVMKSGGNAIKGEIYFDWEDKSFQGNNLTDQLQDKGILVGDKFTRYNDFNVNAGGPYIRDKFWWFFAYHDQFSGLQTQLKFNDGTPGAVFTTRLRNYSAKANYQITSNNQLVFSTQASTKFQPYRGGQGNTAGNYILESTQGQKGGPYKTWKFQLTSVLNNRATLETATNMLDSPSFRYSHVDKTPITDSFTSAIRGGFNDPNNTVRMIWQTYSNLSYFKENLITGTHGFKLGTGYIRGGEYENHVGAPHEAGLIGHASLVYNNGRPETFSVYDTPYSFNYNYSQTYFFLQDKWQISRNITVNAGLRFDRYHGFYPEQGNPGTGPYATKSSFPARDVTGFHNFVPRFSIAWDLFGNTKTALKAGWGRFSENVGTGFVSSVNPMSGKTFRYVWDGTLPITPAVVARSTLQNISGTLTLPTIDPNLKNALSQQYNVGIEHELFRDFGIAANVVRTFGYNKYSTINRAYPTSVYAPVRGIDPGPDGCVVVSATTGCGANSLADNQTITVYERTGPVRADDLFLTNFPGGEHYIAYDIRATKRMSNKWQMVGSWEWDKVNTAPPNSYDPNSLVWGNRAHYTTNVFKILGSYDLPKGFGFSSTFESQKGSQYTRTAQFTGALRNILDAAGNPRTTNLAQGSLTVTIDPQGTYFNPRVNLLNLRLEKTFRITENQTIEGMFDLFNVFNANTVLGTEVLSTRVADRNNNQVPRFGRSNSIVNPIIFRVGARYKF